MNSKIMSSTVFLNDESHPEERKIKSTYFIWTYEIPQGGNQLIFQSTLPESNTSLRAQVYTI